MSDLIKNLDLGTQLKIKFKSGLVKLLTIGSTSPSIFWATDEHGEYRVYRTGDIERIEQLTATAA